MSAVAPFAGEVPTILTELTTTPVDDTPPEIASLAARMAEIIPDAAVMVARPSAPMLRILKPTVERAGLEPAEYFLSGLPLRPHVSRRVSTLDRAAVVGSAWRRPCATYGQHVEVVLRRRSRPSGVACEPIENRLQG